MTQLQQGEDTAVAAGRDTVRADRSADLTETGPRAYLTALAGIDVAVPASSVENPRPDEHAASECAALADVTATISHITALGQLDPPRPPLVSVGQAPGPANLPATAARSHRAGSGRSGGTARGGKAARCRGDLPDLPRGDIPPATARQP